MDKREAWLHAALRAMKPWVEACGDASPFPDPYLSVGFPKSSGGKSAARAIGQCWDKASSGDKKRAHVFVSPQLKAPRDVLSTILHELVHASVGNKCGHRGPFRRVCLELGFKPPMTSTPVGDDLAVRLDELAAELGAYPHATLAVRPRGSVGSRMLKVQCEDCGYTLRTTRKWLEEAGPPICPCNHERMELSQ